MAKNSRQKLSRKQKEAIAEQLADFFFEFWNGRHEESCKRSNRNGEAVDSDEGLLRNFPENSESMT